MEHEHFEIKAAPAGWIAYHDRGRTVFNMIGAFGQTIRESHFFSPMLEDWHSWLASSSTDGSASYLEVNFPTELSEEIRLGRITAETKQQMIRAIKFAMEQHQPRQYHCQYHNMVGASEYDVYGHRSITGFRPFYSSLTMGEVPVAKEPSIEKKGAAADALHNILQRAREKQDVDARYLQIVTDLPDFLKHYGNDAMFEVQHAVLSERYEQDLRSDLLEAVSRAEVVDKGSAAYREWVISQALKSPSHFVRDSAVTSWRAVCGSVIRLREAAKEEPVKRLKDRMEKVASLLEARRGAATST